MSLVQDLLDENQALDAFVAQLSESDWCKPTAFFSWSTFDEIMHLIYVDRFALVSITDPPRFFDMREEQRVAVMGGTEMSTLTRQEFGKLPKAQLIELWREQYLELIAQMSARPLEDRISWFGPDMSIASMVAARQMEVWAHGQDIYDLFHQRRPPMARLRNICDLGVRTFGWSFANRQLPRPGPAPRVTLQAPDGGVWSWNDTAEGSVAGTAEDFAMIVTQRRNVLDTGIVCTGDAAASWMAIAQCFAGPPAEPPKPGTRVWNDGQLPLAGD